MKLIGVIGIEHNLYTVSYELGDICPLKANVDVLATNLQTSARPKWRRSEDVLDQFSVPPNLMVSDLPQLSKDIMEWVYGKASLVQIGDVFEFPSSTDLAFVFIVLEK